MVAAMNYSFSYEFTGDKTEAPITLDLRGARAYTLEEADLAAPVETNDPALAEALEAHGSFDRAGADPTDAIEAEKRRLEESSVPEREITTTASLTADEGGDSAPAKKSSTRRKRASK